jgi:hypothetical protein
MLNGIELEWKIVFEISVPLNFNVGLIVRNITHSVFQKKKLNCAK